MVFGWIRRRVVGVAGFLRRHIAPLALLAGLFFFGVSLLILGTEATYREAIELEPSSLTLANGTATLVYPVDYFGERTSSINVTYAFPQAPGDAYFVGCEDITRARTGAAPQDPLLAFQRLQQGGFVISRQTIISIDPFYTVQEGRYRYVCDPAVVFLWETTGDPAANRPAAVVKYHPTGIVGEDFAMLAILMGGSALAALLGGLAWVRGRAPTTGPATDDSTVEALRSSLERMGAQLERTRRLLLLAGVLGVFLWYPFLVPWTWLQATRATDDPVTPWAAAGLTLVFLLVLTLLWAREFLRLDRELNAWRGRLGELRHREQGLLDELEREGG